MTARPDFTPAAKWPHIGCPTEPGPLTEAELDAHNRDMRPDLEPLSCKPWPLPAIFGPDDGPIYYRPAPTLWQRLRRFLSHAWHG